MHPSLAHLQDIPAAYLDPGASFVVMTEDVEAALHNARLTLDAVAWLCNAASSQNAKLKNAGLNQSFVDIPPESLAALLTLVGEKIDTACHNPTLGAMRKVRPDLFDSQKGSL